MYKYLPTEEFVYMDATLRMSTKRMADFMYAIINQRATIAGAFSLADGYTRQQNAYNNAFIKVHIHPSAIEQFTQISGCVLTKPPILSLNSN